ncbi:MAG: prephenate dehydratase [Mariprofundaceae bacterium]|nr:prephenate dehydratase [Mariprofundaceae bacterium]
MTKTIEQMNLDDLRTAIDAVDDKLLGLIQHRADLASAVGERKISQLNAPFYVPSREANIIRRLLDRNAQNAAKDHATKIPDEAIHGIYRGIIGACLALEHSMTIAFLGPEGTFSHTAAQRQFGDTAQYLPCPNLNRVFEEVEAGRATYGVVPIENAFEGAVNDTHDKFADFDMNVFICAEIQLSIHHQLLSSCEKLSDIDVVYSHPQPLGQCKAWLASHLPKANLCEVASTGKGGEIVQQDVEQAHSAAIVSMVMAEKLGLPVLAANIEDHHHNTTRFFVIGKHDSPPSGQDKTGLVVAMKDEAGALFHLIKPFAARNLDLTRIESRPSKKKLWEYVFFMDVLGHRHDHAVAQAIDDVEAMGATVKILGSYPISRKL